MNFNKMELDFLHRIKLIGTLLLVFCVACSTHPGGTSSGCSLNSEHAVPWVYWYWNDAAVSKEGITADLEAMREIGLGGAYLFFIRGASDPPVYTPPSEQLTPQWWDNVRFAFSEAKRTGISLGLHSCDGFTVAGGPWITPELSMQKVVWTDTVVEGIQHLKGYLQQPETVRGYYEDSKVFAFPCRVADQVSSYDLNPMITTDIPDVDPQFINDPETDKRLRSDDPCWIQYAFEKPFPLRSVTIRAVGNIFQSHRLKIEVSNDGQHFTPHGRLKPHRQGWMDDAANITHAIEPVTARYFRFVYDPEGSEPGAEDLDAAKWKQSLKIAGMELSSVPKIHQYEGKNGSIWRIAEWTSSRQIPDSLYIPAGEIRDISRFMDDEGFLDWEVPPGKWIILRMGHTSTGKENYMGGGGKGLECDKFNPEAVAFQFNQWIGEFYNQVGDSLVTDVLQLFHVDSWECGSQNWSPVFEAEFEKRRGYSLMPYLPVMAGVPVQSRDFSEHLLLDIRKTIAELVTDHFYGTLAMMVQEKGLLFSAESVAPVMVSDGMLHFRNVDIPMGEFWLNSPTHDKPNDVLDAVSAGHIYGKPIIQAESFTEIRLDWNEHPGRLKPLGDRNFALGINRLVFHVFTHNPWMDRKPGMTLGVVGLYFQRDQTWFSAGKAWTDYIRNCQNLLQQGIHRADIAIFTGEEIPRRAILPDRLVPVLPEIFGKETVIREEDRLKNEGLPTHQRPRGVTSAVHIADPSDWTDPLHGYAFDSFNRDALIRLAKVKDRKIVLPGGATYEILVIPGPRRMNPQASRMSREVAEKILELVKSGATILFEEIPERTVDPFDPDERASHTASKELFAGDFQPGALYRIRNLGKGTLIKGPYRANSFIPVGVARDFYAIEPDETQARDLAWTHRSNSEKEIYFVSNQQKKQRKLLFSFRIAGKEPVFYDPVRDEFSECREWTLRGGRTNIPVRLEENESLFVIFEDQTPATSRSDGKNWPVFETIQHLDNNWTVQFDPAFGGPEEKMEFPFLTDWSLHPDKRVRYYSGKAVYSKNFEWEERTGASVWLDVGEVHDLAEIHVNGVNCGVVWTAPFRVDISEAIRKGPNRVEIAVTNTWANRLMGDHRLPEEERMTWTTAAYRLEGNDLLPAGLLGPVKLLEEKIR